MKKRLTTDEFAVSPACPLHSARAPLVQEPERHLYDCTCAWDLCTAAQLRFIRPDP